MNQVAVGDVEKGEVLVAGNSSVREKKISWNSRYYWGQ